MCIFMGIGLYFFNKNYVKYKKYWYLYLLAIIVLRALKISLDYRFYDFVNFFENRR